MREFLRDFAAYAPLAGLLRVNGRVVGFSAGEIVGDTLIIHIEKADIAYEGIYQVLVNEYAKCFVTPDVRYINREEDVGDEGIRRSKESYHPVRLLEKYLVRIPAQPEKGETIMQEVYEFLKKCGTYYLATVDGDQLPTERISASADTNSVYTISAPNFLHIRRKAGSVTSSIGARKIGYLSRSIFLIFIVVCLSLGYRKIRFI